MRAHCLLLRIPGTPFCTNDLRPDRALAAIAGTLTGAGSSAAVLDFGTIEMLDLLLPAELRPALSWYLERHRYPFSPDDASSHPGFLACRGMPRSLNDHHRTVWRRVGEKLGALRDYEFILFNISHLKDLEPSIEVLKGVRAMAPRSILIATGAPFTHGHDLIARGLSQPSDR